jgi:predicted S18 family serine protease
MQITNDIITIETADLVALSRQATAALSAAVSNRMAPEEYLSIVVNSALSSALESRAKTQLDNLNEFAKALAVADDTAKATAQTFLDQAAAAVGVVIKPQPLPEPAQPAVLVNP